MECDFTPGKHVSLQQTGCNTWCLYSDILIANFKPQLQRAFLFQSADDRCLFAFMSPANLYSSETVT